MKILILTGLLLLLSRFCLTNEIKNKKFCYNPDTIEEFSIKVTKFFQEKPNWSIEAIPQQEFNENNKNYEYHNHDCQMMFRKYSSFYSLELQDAKVTMAQLSGLGILSQYWAMYRIQSIVKNQQIFQLPQVTNYIINPQSKQQKYNKNYTFHKLVHMADLNPLEVFTTDFFMVQKEGLGEKAQYSYIPRENIVSHLKTNEISVDLDVLEETFNQQALFMILSNYQNFREIVHHYENIEFTFVLGEENNSLYLLQAKEFNIFAENLNNYNSSEIQQIYDEYTLQILEIQTQYLEALQTDKEKEFFQNLNTNSILKIIYSESAKYNLLSSKINKKKMDQFKLLTNNKRNTVCFFKLVNQNNLIYKWFLANKPSWGYRLQEDLYNHNIGICDIIYSGLTESKENRAIQNNKKQFQILNIDYKEITQKDLIVQALKKMDQIGEYGKYNSTIFFPETFILRSNIENQEQTESENKFRGQNQHNTVDSSWILMKSDNKKDITLFEHTFQIQRYYKNQIIRSKENAVYTAQKYIDNPFTIENKKFDYRCYLFIPSNEEDLRLAYYAPGYIRKSKTDYDISQGFDSQNLDKHLPNDESSQIWTKDQFNSLLQTEKNLTNQDIEVLEKKIQRIVTYVAKTLFNTIENTKSTVMFYGVDIMFDQELEPYLFDINTQPELHSYNDQKKISIDNFIKNFLKVELAIYENFQNRKNIIKTSNKSLPRGDMTLLINEASQYDFIKQTESDVLILSQKNFQQQNIERKNQAQQQEENLDVFGQIKTFFCTLYTDIFPEKPYPENDELKFDDSLLLQQDKNYQFCYHTNQIQSFSSQVTEYFKEKPNWSLKKLEQQKFSLSQKNFEKDKCNIMLYKYSTFFSLELKDANVTMAQLSGKGALNSLFSVYKAIKDTSEKQIFNVPNLNQTIIEPKIIDKNEKELKQKHKTIYKFHKLVHVADFSPLEIYTTDFYLVQEDLINDKTKTKQYYPIKRVDVSQQLSQNNIQIDVDQFEDILNKQILYALLANYQNLREVVRHFENIDFSFVLGEDNLPVIQTMKEFNIYKDDLESYNSLEIQKIHQYFIQNTLDIQTSYSQYYQYNGQKFFYDLKQKTGKFLKNIFSQTNDYSLLSEYLNKDKQEDYYSLIDNTRNIICVYRLVNQQKVFQRWFDKNKPDWYFKYDQILFKHNYGSCTHFYHQVTSQKENENIINEKQIQYFNTLSKFMHGKNLLAYGLQKQDERQYYKEFNSTQFSPETFPLRFGNLTDFNESEQKFMDLNSTNQQDTHWILKSAFESNGRNISLHDNIESVQNFFLEKRNSFNKTSFVAQRYIENTATIHNSKFDYRCYLFIPSNEEGHRLAYFQHGIIRRSGVEYDPTEEFDTENLKKHLTNPKIQKDLKNEELVWSYSQFEEFLRKEHNKSDEFIKLLEIKIKRIMSYLTQSYFNQVGNNVQNIMFYGIDIMYDTDWKPYLLEANNQPDLVSPNDAHQVLVDNFVNNFQNIVMKISDNQENRHYFFKNSEQLPSGDMTLLYNEASGYDYIKDTQSLFN